MNYIEAYKKYKERYLSIKNNINQIGGGIKQKHTDTGAGVILIEKYRPMGQQTYIPCLILFQDKKLKKYTDGGGSRDYGENLKKTATRELKEESLNTFRLNPKVLHDNDAVRHNDYVCYFVYIRGPNKNNTYPIYSKYYYHNKSVIKKNNAPHVWNETNDITRVPVQQFINDGGLHKQGDLQTTDASGNKIIIHSRTKACIREGINQGVYNQVYKKGPITLNENTNYNKGAPFLKKTKVYWS